MNISFNLKKNSLTFRSSNSVSCLPLKCTIESDKKLSVSNEKLFLAKFKAEEQGKFKESFGCIILCEVLKLKCFSHILNFDVTLEKERRKYWVFNENDIFKSIQYIPNTLNRRQS